MKFLITTLVAMVISTPVLADKAPRTDFQDHFKTVLEQTPYNVEVCRDVEVQAGKEFDQNGAIIGGIIGGVIGNQFGKGSGKEAMTGIGALSGAIIGGNKPGGPTRTVRKCYVETRYKETQREIYSHTTVTFWYEGQKYTLNFQK